MKNMPMGQSNEGFEHSGIPIEQVIPGYDSKINVIKESNSDEETKERYLEQRKIEKAEAKAELIQGMMTALDGVYHGRDSKYQPNIEMRRRQKVILEHLPDDFVLEMRGHIKNKYIEEASYGKTEIDIGGTVSGEVFEQFSRAYASVLLKSQLQKEYPATAEDPERAKRMFENYMMMSDTYTALLHNPERFGLEQQLGHGRNPDIIMIDFDPEGNLSIVGTQEVKAKVPFDRRVMSQLKRFPQTCVKAAEEINKLTDRDEFGLKSFGRGEVNVNLEEFTQTVLVPINIDLSNPENLVYKLPEDASDYEKAQRQEFIDMIKNRTIITEIEETVDGEKVKRQIVTQLNIKVVPLSTRELSALTNYVIDRI